MWLCVKRICQTIKKDEKMQVELEQVEQFWGKDQVFHFEQVKFEMSVRYARGDVAPGVDGESACQGRCPGHGNHLGVIDTLDSKLHSYVSYQMGCV